jgi:pyruvate dehydrogenase E1 component
LGGEGLQHQDGSSHVIAATIPNCRAYDPAFAYEVAVIIDRGARRMLGEQRDEFYYITVMNENYAQPSLPPGIEDDIFKGLYRFGNKKVQQARGNVRLVGSGAILNEVIAAADLLAMDWQIAAEIWSATSFSELERDAREVARWNRMHPDQERRSSHVTSCLSGEHPVIAATDYVREYPQLIAPYVDARFVALGTDGFGRSDTRSALRQFFEVDRRNIVVAAIDALVQSCGMDRSLLAAAVHRYEIKVDMAPPWNS